MSDLSLYRGPLGKMTQLRINQLQFGIAKKVNVVVWENSRGPRINYNQSMTSKSSYKSLKKKWVRLKIYFIIIDIRLMIVKLKTRQVLICFSVNNY